MNSSLNSVSTCLKVVDTRRTRRIQVGSQRRVHGVHPSAEGNEVRFPILSPEWMR